MSDGCCASVFDEMEAWQKRIEGEEELLTFWTNRRRHVAGLRIGLSLKKSARKCENVLTQIPRHILRQLKREKTVGELDESTTCGRIGLCRVYMLSEVGESTTTTWQRAAKWHTLCECVGKSVTGIAKQSNSSSTQVTKMCHSQRHLV
ncbi:hypothetical protein Scep_012393 [Stephania cephalantha]|uniref:Uncharacterized protein n=1 Tax=Stephania cephalantha TaxID=152367 RepID=A0AAP0P9H4_9MAGN